MPVLLQSGGAVHRGFITRLSNEAATVSLEGTFPATDDVVMVFRRPSDRRRVRVSGKVTDVASQSGLWRGRPAIQIIFRTNLRTAPAAGHTPVASPPVPPAQIGPAGGITREPSPAEDEIERASRVITEIPVEFILSGRRYSGTACNFSHGGLYVASPEYPRVGSVVRVFFPLETDPGEPCTVEFNGVVRWFQQDRPELELPSGFGVQIMTFENVRDSQLYADLVSRALKSSGGRKLIDDF